MASLRRAVVVLATALTLAGCGQSTPTRSSAVVTASPTTATASPEAPDFSPTVMPATTPASPPEPPTTTLRDLRATLAYAICADDQCDVHVIGSDGVDRNVTDTPQPGTEDHQPDLSPDGRRVLYRCSHASGLDLDANGNDDICAIDIDGTHRRNLTDNTVSDYSTSWSADARRISFASGRSATIDNPNDIYAMDVNGGHVRRITTSVGIDEYPVWSPDGRTIAFSCTDGHIHRTHVGDFEVCLVGVDGRGRERITDTPGICDASDWSADSATLLVTCDPDGNGAWPHDTYLLRGRQLSRLTTTGSYGPKFTLDGLSFVSKDQSGQLWLQSMTGERTRIDAPTIDGDWDIHFARP
jgi:Tol biopolymer transport system component